MYSKGKREPVFKPLELQNKYKTFLYLARSHREVNSQKYEE